MVESWDTPGGGAPGMDPKGWIRTLPGSARWIIPGLLEFARSTGNDTRSHCFFLEIPIPEIPGVPGAGLSRPCPAFPAAFHVLSFPIIYAPTG